MSSYCPGYCISWPAFPYSRVCNVFMFEALEIGPCKDYIGWELVHEVFLKQNIFHKVLEFLTAQGNVYNLLNCLCRRA